MNLVPQPHLETLVRKLNSALLFCLVAVTSAVVGQDPTCDGTSRIEIKCENGKLPNETDWYEVEGAKCQGEMEGVVACKHAIAFNISWFGCSEPKAEGDPPAYTTYCRDSGLLTAECTHKQLCGGVVKTKDGKQYTYCEPQGKVTVTTRLLKIDLKSGDPPATSCIKLVITP